jgi:peroxiredoxin
MTQETIAQLATGAQAPHFATQDAFGTPIDLAAYQGKTLLLSFFRNAACALCNLRVHQLIQKYPEYHSRGLEMLAVFESPRENILQYVGRQDAPFPIVADPQGQLYQLYGVEVSQSKAEASVELPQVQQHVREATELGWQLTPEPGSNFFRLPADFLIGPDGAIQRVYYAAYVGDPLPLAEIEQALGASPGL